MRIIRTLRFIFNHPLNRAKRYQSLYLFLRWQIFSRIIKYPIIFDFGTKCKLIAKKGMAGATGNLYCGLHEFEDMSFLLHYLRESDLFIDVGANIGSYTVLSSGEIGTKTYSFEPSPSTFENLQNNININNISHLVQQFNIALGDKDDTIKFTKGLDTINHVAIEKEANHVLVPVKRLDEIIPITKLKILMKIDVEGYETNVIQGMDKTLSNNDLNAIIIELNGSGRRYGFDENKIHEKLKSHKFLPYKYLPLNRQLELQEELGNQNTIYIRDISLARQRVQNAPAITINSVTY